VRSIGMDVHRDFCEIAIAEDGSVRAAGRVATDPEALVLMAQSLVSTDEVAIEATANAVAIARILEPHVRRVVLANPKAVREKSRRAKTDRIDAKVLARLLAVGFLDEVWTPDDKTQTRRRLITRRCALVRARTRAKNQVHAVLARNLLERPPMTDMFGRRGRIWLAEQAERLPLDEQLSVDAGLRQVDFLNGEVDQIDQILGADAITDPDALRLMTLPGVNMVTAIALLAAIGDIKRFPTARQLVAYLGLDPRVRQSGNEPARHGRISKQGPGEIRGLLVEAAWHAARTPGPLHGFHERLSVRRGSKIATVATARKMVVIAWHLLSRGQQYAFMRPALLSREDPQARASARRPAPPRPEPDRPPTPQDRPAPSREGDCRPAREGVSADGRRLASVPTSPREGGRGCDTGARISKALEGQSRAADSIAPRSALRFVSHPRPRRVFHPDTKPSRSLDFHP
jgi:transposase